MENDVSLIGQRIKTARKAKRYTQDYVSSQIGIGEKFLSQIECGKVGVSIKTLLDLCNILEVSPNYILLGEIFADNENPISKLLKQLTPKQVQYAEEILKTFVKSCLDKK